MRGAAVTKGRHRDRYSVENSATKIPGALVLALLLGCAAAPPLPKAPQGGKPSVARKKIIQYGHDAPSPAFVREHVRDMEKRPFDGVVIRMPKHQFMFDTNPWSQVDLRPDHDALAATKWERFTDNFLFINGTNEQQRMNWFNDPQWDTIVANMKLFGRLVRDGRLAGICFDPEPYGKLPEGADTNPWFYPGTYPVDKLARLPAQVRARGRQVMAALQTEAPAVRFLNFHLLARLLYDIDPNAQRWVDWQVMPDVPGEPSFHHRGHKYALLGEFMMGMLEVANPGVVFVDGNENSYYYTDHVEFAKARHLIREGARSIVPAELWQKYSKQVQVGTPVFPNWLMGDWPSDVLGFVPPQLLTPWEQLRYVESQLYNALGGAEEYVWLYNEHMDFWRPIPETGKDRLPDGLEAALISARRKYETGQPLGFDVAPLVRRARDRLLAGEKPPQSAHAAKPGN